MQHIELGSGIKQSRMVGIRSRCSQRNQCLLILSSKKFMIGDLTGSFLFPFLLALTHPNCKRTKDEISDVAPAPFLQKVSTLIPRTKFPTLIIVDLAPSKVRIERTYPRSLLSILPTVGHKVRG